MDIRARAGLETGATLVRLPNHAVTVLAAEREPIAGNWNGCGSAFR